jgi:hypothetical protein
MARTRRGNEDAVQTTPGKEEEAADEGGLAEYR